MVVMCVCVWLFAQLIVMVTKFIHEINKIVFEVVQVLYKGTSSLLRLFLVFMR
jgi:hypothetical protein